MHYVICDTEKCASQRILCVWTWLLKLLPRTRLRYLIMYNTSTHVLISVQYRQRRPAIIIEAVCVQLVMPTWMKEKPALYTSHNIPRFLIISVLLPLSAPALFF